MQTYLSHKEYVMPNNECNFTISVLVEEIEVKGCDILNPMYTLLRMLYITFHNILSCQKSK